MTNEKDSDFKFYYIDDEYLDFLRNPEWGDDKVPKNDYTTRKKFFIKTGLIKNGLEYFVPVSSKVKLSNNYEYRVKDESGQRYVAAVKANFMIPVPEGVYSRLSMSALKNDPQYKNLVRLEHERINEEENKTAILDYVNMTYTFGGSDLEHVVNFAKLENVAANYDVETHNAKRLQKKYKLNDSQIATMRAKYDELVKTDNPVGLEKIIRNTIHNAKAGVFDPEIKAMVDQAEERVRVFCPKGKNVKPVYTSIQPEQSKKPELPAELKEISSKYGISPEKCVAMKKVADKSKLDVKVVARSFVYDAKDGAVNKQAQAKVRAEVNAQREQRTANRQVSTQEKINSQQPVVTKPKRKDSDQNSR